MGMRNRKCVLLALTAGSILLWFVVPGGWMEKLTVVGIVYGMVLEGLKWILDSPGG